MPANIGGWAEARGVHPIRRVANRRPDGGGPARRGGGRRRQSAEFGNPGAGGDRGAVDVTVDVTFDVTVDGAVVGAVGRGAVGTVDGRCAPIADWPTAAADR